MNNLKQRDPRRMKSPVGTMWTKDEKTNMLIELEVFTPEEEWYLIYNGMSFGKETGYKKYKDIKNNKIPADPDMKVKDELVQKYYNEKRTKRKWLLAFSTLILLMGVSGFLLIK